MPDLDQNLEPPDVDTDTPPRRRIALAVAAIALVGAGVAAASAITDGIADRERRDAQRRAIAALATRSAALADLYDARSRRALYDGLAARRTLASTRAEVYGSESIAGETNAWAQALKDIVEAKVNPFAGTSSTGVELFALSTVKQKEADLESLESEARRETAGSWAHKADLYFMAVTMLAVVLALLGLSISVGDGLGRWFFMPAGALLVAALVAAGWATLAPVTRTPESAWTAVADGNGRLAAGDYQAAIDAYGTALELRKGYVTALRQRATATVAASSLQVGTYVISNSTAASYEQASHDLDRALDLGARDFLTLTNQGAALFHLRQYERSERLSREALRIQPLPLPMSNLGLVIAAQGRELEAEQTYERFIELAESPGRDPLERAELYSSSLTTLDKLARLEPGRANLVVRLQGLISSAWASHTAVHAAGSESAQGTLAVQATQTTLQVDLRHTGIMSGDPVAWAVYYRAKERDDWIHRQDLSYFGEWTLPAAGTATHKRVDATCLPAGDLRVDIFVSGRRIASSTVEHGSVPKGYQPFVDRRTGLSGCRPPAWAAEEAPGLISYRGDDGSSFVVRSVPLASRDPTVAVRAALDRASGRLRMPQGLAARPHIVAGIQGLRRGAGLATAWAAVRGDSVLVVTSQASRSDPLAPTWVWSSLVFT